jgi:hypothetical protein
MATPQEPAKQQEQIVEEDEFEEFAAEGASEAGSLGSSGGRQRAGGRQRTGSSGRQRAGAARRTASGFCVCKARQPVAQQQMVALQAPLSVLHQHAIFSACLPLSQLLFQRRRPPAPTRTPLATRPPPPLCLQTGMRGRRTPPTSGCGSRTGMMTTQTTTSASASRQSWPSRQRQRRQSNACQAAAEIATVHY